MGRTELQEQIRCWKGSGKCIETRGRDHFLHFWLDSRLGVLKTSQVGSACASTFRNQLPPSETEIREDFGEEAKLLSKETADILRQNVKATFPVP